MRTVYGKQHEGEQMKFSVHPNIEHMCPVYFCDGCTDGDEYCWPAFDLFWWRGNKSEYGCDSFPPGWYCEPCLSQMPADGDNTPPGARITLINFLSGLTEANLREHVARARF